MECVLKTAETARRKRGPAAALMGCSKIFGMFAALRNVTVEFTQGSCTMLLGENGAGKSTLLRLVAGLMAPTRGSVEVFGEKPGAQRARIAYMSHAPMLYDELTAMENLTYFAGLHRGAECDCVGNPEMALRAVGLDPFLKRPVGQYSQGMRQRTSLARVMQTDPELLLLDEPFSNLDVASARQMVELLADFRTWPVAGGGKRTIVLTTHQAALAERLADRTLTMAGGEADLVSGKTNAVRMLDGLGIRYELRAYEVDLEDLTAVSVAKKIGMPVEQVFKTLVTVGGGGEHAFGVIPGDAELDFKKLAVAAGAKWMEMVSVKEVEPLTGYVRGGVTVMGARKAFPAYMDETVELFEEISVSAGLRGLQVVLAPGDYLRATGAVLADLTKASR